MIPATLGVFINGFSSILTGLNFVVTIHRLRAPGMTWMRLPLFVWAHLRGQHSCAGHPGIGDDGAPAGDGTVSEVGLFDPALGGDPLLFQHLFWFYSHPAVYIMILPAMGVVSEIITCFARKPFLATAMACADGDGGISFLVWGHHMFTSGHIGVCRPRVLAVDFSLSRFRRQSRCSTGRRRYTRDRSRFDAPMLYALGFIRLFTIGGLTGLILATLALDVHLHDTYFVVAHFHYIMVGGTVIAYFGGLHFWWPKITGRHVSRMWARFAAVLIFVGFNLTFFPQFMLGYDGMPRRYYTYPAECQVLNVLSSAGASILAVGYLLPLGYFGWSLFFGKRAGPTRGMRPASNGRHLTAAEA